ncbi:MAG: leucine-rich repeat protein, partial [Oscillospiraceae bacterium]|nr:leucine-rich repeat protein [Oscillospiraceae bacterium]
MRTKRFLAAFLALCLSLALLPSGVIAVESEAEAELPAPEYQQLEAAQSDLEDREESVEALLDVAESPAMPMGETLTYGDLYYTVSGNIITITGCADGVTSLTIPAQIDGKSVTAIANYAFDGCNSLMKLTIPEGVTDLGYYMIRGTAISSITIPSTVTTSGCYYYN